MSHPIHILWCHPRSVSTAIERVMRARGDLTCLHEPFMYHYYIHRGVRRFPHFAPDPDRPRAYGDIRDDILARAEAGPVFVKDMAFSAMPDVLDDDAFLARSRHAFLVRAPRAAIASYWRKDADVTCEEVGLEAQWRLWARLNALGHSAPVLRSEPVQADPRGRLGDWWTHAGLSPAPHAFTWQPGLPDDWRDVAGWHDSVGASTGIRAPAPGDNGFAEALTQAPHLADYLAHHQPFYDRLAAIAAP